LAVPIEPRQMIEATDEIRSALADMGLAHEDARCPMTPLGGGVSCDVYLVDLPGERIVVKRALPKLRVAADWRAPPERSEAEVAWIRLVARIERRLVPGILGEDRGRHIFAMEYLPPERFPLWKARLSDGRIQVEFAARVGAALAQIHSVTAGREDIAAMFDNGPLFHALRIEPYLSFTAERNPDVARTIERIADQTAASRIALMQGDISPKNILCGPDGPVFLDAETASYGDPAFDLAFCLNHLLLKGVWHPLHADALAGAFRALKASYFEGVTWEAGDGLDRRAARLLAALLLARIDGKSPVEYLTDERSKAFVRALAKEFLEDESPALGAIADRWTAALKAY
jgi:aminoglycoside phosphotransferase (APT) family kinase protein